MTAMGDDPLIHRLVELCDRLDPVPPDLLDQVRQAFCWRTVDADLAELSFDSLVDRDAALAVRAGADSDLEPRMLGFGAVVDGEDVSIELEVSTAGQASCLVGQLWPAVASTVDVQSGAGSGATVPVDELGRFVVEPVPQGPVRLRIRHGDRTVQTTWVSYVRS
jgi:hypothetical protein